MSSKDDHSIPESTHHEHPPHIHRASFIQQVSVHRPSFVHRISSAIHRIPSHAPDYVKLFASYSSPHAGHHDVSRWHHHLHPHVIKECARNALPRKIAHFIHPTAAVLIHAPRSSLEHFKELTRIAWTSRNQRKHRYVEYSPGTERGRHADTLWSRLANMRRIEYWNVSWWVAQAFTWGSVVWCVNGFAAWLPFVQHQLAQTLIMTGWTAFIGATIFEFGSILGILEAWNRDDTASFGWSVISALNHMHKPGEVLMGRWGKLTNPPGSENNITNAMSDKLDEKGPKVKTDSPSNEKQNGDNSDSSGHTSPHSTVNGQNGEHSESSDRTLHSTSSEDTKHSKETAVDPASAPPPVQRIPSMKHTVLQMENIHSKHNPRAWIWFSADPRYFHELGFLAAFFQLLGASVFWISGFTAIPSIQEILLEHIPAWKGAFWVPQVVGGSGFIISSSFLMLECQDVWYKPKPLSLGWHVGFWNFIGGIGFTTCGALGYFSLDHTAVAYQSALCTFWGSWAFLIGSLIQWYESVNAV